MDFLTKVKIFEPILQHREPLRSTDRLMQIIFEERGFIDSLWLRFYRRKKVMPAKIAAIFYIASSEILFFERNIHALTIKQALDAVRGCPWSFWAKPLQAFWAMLITRREEFLNERKLNSDQFIELSFDPWLVQRWKDRYGLEQTRVLIEYFQKTPSLHLVVNLALISTEQYCQALETRGIRFESPFPALPIVVIDEKVTVRSLPGYADGWFWVQDTPAFLLTKLIAPGFYERILDVCAVPGGKSMALSLFIRGNIWVLNDRYYKKFPRLRENLGRLKNSLSQLTISDGRVSCFKNSFSLVLLDAPCSALGIIQKIGDLRRGKTPEMMCELIELQCALLEEAGRIVAPDGFLLYSTCTLEPEENEQQIGGFLQRHPDFHVVFPDLTLNPWLKPFITPQGYFYSLPFIHQLSGAFAALLQRKPGESR